MEETEFAVSVPGAVYEELKFWAPDDSFMPAALSLAHKLHDAEPTPRGRGTVRTVRLSYEELYELAKELRHRAGELRYTARDYYDEDRRRFNSTALTLEKFNSKLDRLTT